MLPPASIRICGSNEPFVLAARSSGVENVAPPLVECVKNTPKVMSSFSHTTLILPAASTDTCGLALSAASRERFCGAEKVAPPSLERLKRMSQLPGVSSTQTTLRAPLLSTEMRGLKENPELLEMFVGVENVKPPSVERLNRILELVAVSSSHTTLMLPAASTPTCG